MKKVIFLVFRLVCCLFATGLLLGTALPSAWAVNMALPAGFQETVAFSGLTQPTALQFSPDGRIFVAEKRG